MKILFDQGTPVPLRRSLSNHQVATAFERGWGNKKNGELLSAAESEGFEAIVTTDQNLKYQQNLAERRLAILVLMTPDWRTIREHTDIVSTAVETLQPGSYQELALPPPPGGSGTGAAEGTPPPPNRAGLARQPSDYVTDILRRLRWDNIPEWDGDGDTALTWLRGVERIAEMGPDVSGLLGKLVPQRLKGRVGDWFSSQSPEVRAQATESWDHLVHWILSVYLGENWRRTEELKYKNMTFRDSSTKLSRKEMPSDFILRRTFHYRMIRGGTPHTIEEVLDVMSAAPKEWISYVRWRHMPNVAQVLATTRLWDQELVDQWELHRKDDRRPGQTRAHTVSTARSPKSAHAADSLGYAQEPNFPETPLGEPDSAEEDQGSAFVSQTNHKDAPRTPSRGTGMSRTSKNRKQDRERVYKWSARDDKISNKPPPGPCFACGSLKHWNKDCPHWGTYEALKAAGKLPSAMAHSVERDYDSAQESYFLELAENEADAQDVSAF